MVVILRDEEALSDTKSEEKGKDLVHLINL